MKKPSITTLLGLALVAVTATLAACGSAGPATVTVTRTVPATTTTATSSTTSTTSTSAGASSHSSSTTGSSSTATTTTAAASTSTSTTTETQTTRTETAPAFVGTNPTGGTAIGHDLAAAIAVVEHAGYVPLGTGTYDPGNTLRVLIGRRPGTASERAFFFDETIYLGTDAATASQQISMAFANDTEVTLSYAIFSPGASAPTGHRDVRFALDMGQLSAVDPLPSVAKRR
jgi:predicted small lipoprotein YifL